MGNSSETLLRFELGDLFQQLRARVTEPAPYCLFGQLEHVGDLLRRPTFDVVHDVHHAFFWFDRQETAPYEERTLPLEDVGFRCRRIIRDRLCFDDRAQELSMSAETSELPHHHA